MTNGKETDRTMFCVKIVEVSCQHQEIHLGRLSWDGTEARNLLSGCHIQ